MSRIILGVDPGFTGAIAAIGPDGYSTVYDMPVFPAAAGKTEINHHGLLAILRNWEAATVWIEKVSAMPGQGVTSMFRFGQGYGAIEMACAACDMTVRYVTPAKWKAWYALGKDKDAARAVAMQRLPAQAPQLMRKKDAGRAEALLIALYGARIPA